MSDLHDMLGIDPPKRGRKEGQVSPETTERLRVITKADTSNADAVVVLSSGQDYTAPKGGKVKVASLDATHSQALSAARHYVKVNGGTVKTTAGLVVIVKS